MSVTESASQSQDAGDERQLSLVRQAELIISHVLRGGVLLSAAVVLVGAARYYFERGAQPASAPGGLTYPHTLGGVIPALAAGSPEAIITLGLLILLATPVVRVAVSIAAFALEHDWR